MGGWLILACDTFLLIVISTEFVWIWIAVVFVGYKQAVALIKKLSEEHMKSRVMYPFESPHVLRNS